MNYKTTKLLSKILLISVCVAGASVTALSQEDKSVSRSPVRTNALALISELEKPTACPADETLCLAESLQSKLDAAIAGLKSIVRIDEQREGIIADMEKRIEVRGAIIDDLQKIDRNSQTIDTRGQDAVQIFRDQHRDDKEVIGKLQDSLDSCRSNQKWVFGAGALTGAAITWKIKDAAPNLFQSNPFASFQSGPQYVMTFQTTADEQARRALRNFRK